MTLNLATGTATIDSAALRAAIAAGDLALFAIGRRWQRHDTKNEEALAYLEQRLTRGVHKGIGEFHLHGSNNRNPVLKRITEIAAQRVPRDLDEACRSLRLGGWQRFWRLEVPFAMPGTPALGDAQARALLSAPDAGMLKGKRDRATVFSDQPGEVALDEVDV